VNLGSLRRLLKFNEKPRIHSSRKREGPARSQKMGMLNGMSRELSRHKTLTQYREAGEYLRAGITSAGNEDYREAIASFDLALRAKPRCHQAWNNKGVCHLRLGDLDEAKRCFRKSIEIDPTYTIAWVNSNLLNYRAEIREDDPADLLVKLATI
jgi:Flp pilus assembly protein TadD